MERNKNEENRFVVACILASAIDRHLIKPKDCADFLTKPSTFQVSSSFQELSEELKYFVTIKGNTQDTLDFIRDALLTESKSDYYKRAFATGIYSCIFGEKNYPALLQEITAPPYILFVKGEKLRNDTSWQKSCLTIIGTRKPSDYGIQVTKNICAELAKRQAVIVSGLAYGIDSCAQKTALDHSGMVIAVLASALDRVYPRMHIGIFNELCRNGFAISEHAPGSELYRQYFPARNRIMSGISQVTVVIESSQRSGTQITVEQALAQGRDIWAVPGPIFSPQSKGVNALIQNGAFVLHDIQEFLNRMKEADIIPSNIVRNRDESQENDFSISELEEQDLKNIVSELAAAPASAEQLALRLEKPVNEIYILLSALEEMNLLRYSGTAFVLTGFAK